MALASSAPLCHDLRTPLENINLQWQRRSFLVQLCREKGRRKTYEREPRKIEVAQP
jgi:hypothetical protein